MTSVPQQAEALQRILEEEAIRLAKETGFIERERAFDGADFAQALILGWLQQPDERLEGFTQILERREVSITASGPSQRFTKEAATFMQRLLERLAEVQMQAEAVDVPLLRRFSAVTVEDRSSVMLPPELVEVWRGCGGSQGTSEAAVKLFVRWDVLGGTLEGPRLVDGRHSDNKSPFNDDDLPAGALYLADLGFFADVPAVSPSPPTRGRQTLFCDATAIRHRALHPKRPPARVAWHLAARGGRGERDRGVLRQASQTAGAADHGPCLAGGGHAVPPAHPRGRDSIMGVSPPKRCCIWPAGRSW